MDVFVVSSVKEGLPSDIPEAATAGLPIVATRMAGIPEVVVYGRSGLPVPPGDPEALSGGIVASFKTGKWWRRSVRRQSNPSCGMA